MYCSACGVAINQGLTYCKNCGAKVLREDDRRPTEPKPENIIVMMVATLCLAAAGINGYLPVFWSLPTSFLTGSVAAVAIGLINSVGNLGGFVGPYVVGYVNSATNSFFGGLLYLSMSALVAACLILKLRHEES